MSGVEPVRGSVMGAGKPTTVAPPRAVVNRQVVAQHAPAQPPVPFAQRQDKLVVRPVAPVNQPVNRPVTQPVNVMPEPVNRPEVPINRAEPVPVERPVQSSPQPEVARPQPARAPVVYTNDEARPQPAAQPDSATERATESATESATRMVASASQTSAAGAAQEREPGARRRN